MLSCSCDGDYDWFVEEYEGEDFKPLATKRGRRCHSCKVLIAVGETSYRVSSYRNPQSDYEERRFGDRVELADLFLCEHCGEIWLNLNATGLCVSFGDMRDAQREYWEMTGFDPSKYQRGEV